MTRPTGAEELLAGLDTRTRPCGICDALCALGSGKDNRAGVPPVVPDGAAGRRGSIGRGTVMG